MADLPDSEATDGLAEPVRRPLEVDPMVRKRTVLRSASVRFAVLYGLVFGVSTIVLAASLRYTTLGLLSRQTEVAIRADGAGLLNHYRTGGIPAVVLALRNRIRENPDDSAIYLLVDPLGNRVIGNMSAWPQAVNQDNVLYSLPIEHFNKKSAAQLRAYALPDGDQLLVGRDIEMQVKLRRILRDAMIWALAAMVGLGVVGALVVRGLFSRSIGDISATTRAVARGDLSKRVRRDYTGDEFDIMAETINDMLDRIARLMDGVRQVSNAIAHDLRTPIARARTRLEFAASHSTDADELRAAIERATAELDGVVRVFQALLRIAEIEAGARRSAFASINLTPVIADLAEFYEAAAEERGITFDASWPEALNMIGDVDMLQQAIANLLDNAIKFAPDGGVVRLAARRDSEFIEIHITDNGPGIPEADRARATERFYRAEAARNTPGTGLGLALVAAIAQLHNGRIRLEDNHPGLRAVLVLPRDNPKPTGNLRERLLSVTKRKPVEA
jgi:signal transduction histidine kinase